MSGDGVGAGGTSARPAADLVVQLEAAREMARRLMRDSVRLLAAAQTTMDASARLVAHALPDIGDAAATKGVTLCDLLAGDEVLVVPDLQWDDVARDQQCEACAESALALAGA